jgi:hypothetical protein
MGKWSFEIWDAIGVEKGIAIMKAEGLLPLIATCYFRK